MVEMQQKTSAVRSGCCSGCQPAIKLWVSVSECLGGGGGGVGFGGWRLKEVEAVLEGVHLRHFKAWLFSFYRPYQVSQRLPAMKKKNTEPERKSAPGCRVLG